MVVLAVCMPSNDNVPDEKSNKFDPTEMFSIGPVEAVVLPSRTPGEEVIAPPVADIVPNAKEEPDLRSMVLSADAVISATLPEPLVDLPITDSPKLVLSKLSVMELALTEAVIAGVPSS
jgi:hypothetical protein